MLEERDDTILARWLSGELNPEERQAFEKSEAYKDYMDIINGVDRFIKPSFDREALRSKLFLVLDAPQKGKIISLKPWYYAAAACIVILLSLGVFFNEVHYTTAVGEQQTVALPDGSTVRLNADSHLKRARFFWSGHKKLSLVKGEGFFEVEKGDGFEVHTTLGKVQVLGTKFNVKNRQDYFEVACYEGKVQFEESESKTKTILVQGQKVIKMERDFNRETVTNLQPTWLEGESIFTNTPLHLVLRELEIQYGITFEMNGGVDINNKFTGGFVHNNLDTALTAVLVPMGIQYTLGKDNKTLLLTTE
jgi:ferric-dicitrate binding protein FerR (iron transport regulator)